MKRLTASVHDGGDLDHTKWILILSALFCLLSPSAAAGQTFRGGISGTVMDSTGAVIPLAGVGVEHESTGMKLRMETSASGVFSFADLPIGLYTAIISHPGFQAERITNVEVQAGRTTSLAVTLKVGGATETETVSADAAMTVYLGGSLNFPIARNSGSLRRRSKSPASLT
jgi:Carboxypeptidase regulatory-like domain